MARHRQGLEHWRGLFVHSTCNVLHVWLGLHRASVHAFRTKRGSTVTTTAATPNLAPEMLLDPSVIEDPYPFYRHLVEEAPVWHIPGTDVVLVSSFDAINEAVGRPEDFSSNLVELLYRRDDGLPGTQAYGRTDIQALSTADPPFHPIHRRAVFPELVAKRMSSLRGEIQELASFHVGEAVRDTPVEAMQAIANPVPIRVVSKLIGFRNEDPDELLKAAFTATAVLAATGPLEYQLEANQQSFAVLAWINDQLRDAIDGGPAEGILSVIAASVNAGDLDRGQAFSVMATLLSAGGESTTSLLGNALHVMASRPDLQRQLRIRRELLLPFIEEMLRLESPFRYHLRHVTRTTVFRGVEVPEGATMLLMWGAANRDPAEFDRPDEIILDRPTPRHHVGFGRGMHLCVGAPLARIEAEVILGEVLDQTEHFELVRDDTPVREPSLVVRRFKHLPLALTAA